MKRLIEYDPVTKISTWFDYDPGTDITTVGRMQDVEPFLEQNKRLQNDSEYTKEGFKKGMWHYATIPNIIQEKWRTEDGIDIYNKNHSKAFFRKLNSPEYRFLKTTDKHFEPKR